MNRTIGTGGIMMLLLLSLAAIGIGIALWSKVLTIEGVVRTGNVNAVFARVFTDDDDAVDHQDFDSQDNPLDCLIHVGPGVPPPGFPDKFDGDRTSCDPAETGRDPKAHYDKDVARCDAVPTDNDEEQEGNQSAIVAITNGYPSYHCTAWFFIRNNGSIPVLLHSVILQGLPTQACQLGSTPYDLDGDTTAEVEICVSGFECVPGNPECGEPQIDPGEIFPMDLDIHILQAAPQNADLRFTAEVCLHQWNEETGFCPGGSSDRIIDADGTLTRGDGIGSCGLPAILGSIDVAVGDPITFWPGGSGVGIDWFDKGTPGNGIWDVTCNGDDLHSEDALACPTALRDGKHDLGLDCKILDHNNDLAAGEGVECDLETGTLNPNGFSADGVACPPTNDLGYFDENNNGSYDDGEDIVLDGNGNGIFD